MLRENNAIVAGGSVLSAINNEPIKDIDIYVNLKNAQKVYIYLQKNLSTSNIINRTHVAPPYDESFLIQNNIMGRLFLRRNSLLIDLMIVHDNITLESVVDNFDLSFCKVWYNGTNILTKYYDNIQDKKGTLGINYLEKYISGNWFTIKRIQKYCRKGYTISLPNINTSSISIQKTPKKVISGEEWSVYKLIQILFDTAHYYNSFNNNDGSFLILILSMLQEYKDAHNKDKLYNIDAFKYIMRQIYQVSITDFWTIDMLIYTLICSTMYGADICVWKLSKKYFDYFKDIGLKLFSSENEPAHGFNGFDIPLCSGTVPPFSPGKNGFPVDATSRDLKNQVREGIAIIKHIGISSDHITELYYRYYPYLKAELLERAIEVQRYLPDGVNPENATPEQVEIAELLDRAIEVQQYLPDGVNPENATLEQVEIAEAEEVAAQQLLQAARQIQFQQRMPIVRAEQERLARERRKEVELELKRHKERLDEGLITEEEYQAKSNELLGVPDTETFDIDDVEVQPRCFNTYAYGEINTRTWYPESGHILFLIQFLDGTTKLVCTSIAEINITLLDESLINYKCTPKDYVLRAGTTTRILISDITEGMSYNVSMNDIDVSIAYIPFTYAYDGSTAVMGYITETNMHRILQIAQQTDGVRLFRLQFSDTISHTACKRNTNLGTIGFDFVSTNHCQMGSAIMVFDVVDLDEDDEIPESMAGDDTEESESEELEGEHLWPGGPLLPSAVEWNEDELEPFYVERGEVPEEE